MNRAWIVTLASVALWAILLSGCSLVFGAEPLAYRFFCVDHPVECRREGEGVISLSHHASLLVRVNSSVNAAIKPREDDGLDTWSLSPSSGDCEDYALTKRSILRRAGLPTEAMRIGIFKLPSGETHAVLVVRTDRGELVLDSRTDRIVERSHRMEMI